MEVKVCDYCKKSVVRVPCKKETEGGIFFSLKMRGNDTIKDFPFSKVFDVNLELTLCDDCATKIFDTFTKCGQECIATRKPSEMNGKGEWKTKTNFKNQIVKNGKQKGSSNELPPKCESDVLS